MDQLYPNYWSCSIKVTPLLSLPNVLHVPKPDLFSIYKNHQNLNCQINFFDTQLCFSGQTHGEDDSIFYRRERASLEETKCDLDGQHRLLLCLESVVRLLMIVPVTLGCILWKKNLMWPKFFLYSIESVKLSSEKILIRFRLKLGKGYFNQLISFQKQEIVHESSWLTLPNKIRWLTPKKESFFLK